MGCNQSKSKPYGGSLSVMWAQSPEIPIILILCGKYLELPPACIENGLFRTPASRYIDSKPTESGEAEALQQNPSYDPRVLSIRQYRSLANVQRTAAIPWSLIHDPLVVAGLYKLFFRQMSPPLLTYILYDKWINTQLQLNQLAYVVSMRSLVAALPEAHQKVLIHTLDLFEILLRPKNAIKNGLTIEHLAHEFGPLFLRPLKSGEGARSRYRDRGAQIDTSNAVKCLSSMMTMRNHIFNRTNEDEFVRLSRDNDTLRAKQIAHDQVMDAMRVERDKHRDHKHAVIIQTHQKANVRRWLQIWKTNVDNIHGVKTVHQKLTAVQHDLSKAHDNARKQNQVIERMRNELAAATRRNEMLEIVSGGSASEQRSVSVSNMGTPGRRGL
jgi:cell division septum initiation protein DivIVA